MDICERVNSAPRGERVGGNGKGPVVGREVEREKETECCRRMKKSRAARVR